MITKVKIYNRFHMDQLARYPDCTPMGKYWYLISIHGDSKIYLTSNTIESLQKYGLQKYLSLEFWDISNSDYKNVKNSFPQCKIFSKDQAKKVIDFLDIIKKDDNDNVLVVHCDAGISRSGAVGTFACDYLNLDYNEFIKENPYIMANQYVLRTLRECAGLTYCKNSGVALTDEDFSNMMMFV
jgi:predicted protein tyrosine phosphatase